MLLVLAPIVFLLAYVVLGNVSYTITYSIYEVPIEYPLLFALIVTVIATLMIDITLLELELKQVRRRLETFLTTPLKEGANQRKESQPTSD